MPTPESDMRNDHDVNRWNYLRWASLIFIVGSLLYKFFDRSAMFHDEIINVAIGKNADIFNYASRPVFYTINTLGVRFLGIDTLALSFAAYVAFVICAAYTYHYMKRDFGALAGVAGVAALAWSGLIYYIGIRGMPHLYPAVFFMAALYHYHQVPISRQGWLHHGLLSVLLWLTLLSHPTALALLVGFFAMVGLDALRAWSALGTKAVARILLTWSIPMMALWGVVEALYYAFSIGHRSYAGYWIAGLHKTSSDTYQHYFEPYGFYFEKLATMLQPLMALLVILGLWLAWKMWHDRKNSSVFAADGWSRATSLLVVAVVSVTVISLDKWKFDRVLVTFVPVVMLSIVYLIFRVAESISWRRQLLFAISAGFVVIASATSFVGQAKAGESGFLSRYQVYSASFDAIRHLAVPSIGYIGDVRDLRGAAYPVQGSGKTMEMMKLSREAAGDESAMARELMAAGNRYVIISMLGDQQTIRIFHRLAHSVGFSRKAIFSSRQAYELWELSPNYLGQEVEEKLEILPKGARLGLLLDRKRDVWMRWALDGKRFKYRQLGKALDAESIKAYAFVFLSTSSKNVKQLQNSLTKSGMHKVGEIPAIDGGKNSIEMWGRS